MADQWWGSFDLEESRSVFWQIGPLRLWVTRFSEELRLATDYPGDGTADTLRVAVHPPEEPGLSAETARLGFRSAPGQVHLIPSTADRPVVVSSHSPFFIPPGEEIVLFVSTSLRLRIRSAPSGKDLLEVPLSRPSDTWFGPSTMEGELCYAARIGIHYELPNLPRRPHRATTVVRIRNRASSQLELERLKLPLPNLSLFAAESGLLWTEMITLERETEDESAAVFVAPGAPSAAGRATRVAEPRIPLERGFLTRTFGSLFGLRGAKSYERASE